MTLMTEWGEKINRQAPLQEYPRMQMQRDSFMSLNGTWEYQITEEGRDPFSTKWKQITVPFALGSALSGTPDELKPGQTLWYRKQFAYKPGTMHTWLNFEAVDQICTVYLNGIEVGTHRGGYVPFSFDVSSMIKYQNALMVKVRDDSDSGAYAYGKQKVEHSGMWYTPSSGIWQSVWLEDIGDHAVHDIKITPDYDEAKVYIDLAGNFSQAVITISAGGLAVHRGITNQHHYEAPMEQFRAWSPDDPFLYDLYVQTEDDVVKSYFGMRKFSAGTDSSGNPCFCLNNKPLFINGLLDQGYTPDGLMTYPADQAMITEIRRMKDMGFNMLRKHVKVENRRWYYHCDRIGMLVMQDIPNGGGPYDYWKVTVLPHFFLRRFNDENNRAMGRVSGESRRVYYEELDEILDHLYNTVSVFAWVPFNEGWGQFQSAKVTEHIREYDSTRLIDSASGWHDQGCGDFNSRHNYFHSFIMPKQDGRILFISEFGGYSYLEWGHSQAEKLYGYKKFTDRIELSNAVIRLYENDILANIPKGLAGCVYTQVSDVEDECNGLYTADRKMIKIDEKKMRRISEQCIRRLK